MYFIAHFAPRSNRAKVTFHATDPQQAAEAIELCLPEGHILEEAGRIIIGTMGSQAIIALPDDSTLGIYRTEASP